jgi:DNA-binding Lrp family transcriptional regulator
MSESDRLVTTLKQLLRKNRITYRQVAQRIGLSEQSVKRLFSRKSFTVDRMVQIAALMDMSFAEVASHAEEQRTTLRTLTEAQEKEVVAEPLLLLVAACVLSGWTMEEIISLYKVSSAECIKRLVKLERIGLITLLPGNRVRPNVARGFDWRPGGPIQRFFRAQEKSDYLASDFTGEGEAHFFLYGMLTPTANLRLQGQLRKLREEFFELHREGLALPLSQRSNCCLLVAQRHWEPKAFASMRREPR